MKLLIAFASLSLANQAFAQPCVSGFDMEGKPTRIVDSSGYPTGDALNRSETISFATSDTTRLAYRVNQHYAMFLYVPAFGNYISSSDWSYCPDKNEVRLNGTGMRLRGTNYIVPRGYSLVVMYAGQ